MSVGELAKGERQFAQRAESKRSLYPFGYGDGGGGPTRAMLESARRLADLEGRARVEFDTVASFWEKVRAESRESAGVGRRALPRVPPGHLHDQRPDQAAQPAQRAGAARRRAVVGRGGRLAGDWSAYPADALDEAWKLLLAQPVPRHHPRLEHPLGQRRLPARPRADRGGRRRSDRERAAGDRAAGRHDRHDATVRGLQRRVAGSPRARRDPDRRRPGARLGGGSRVRLLDDRPRRGPPVVRGGHRDRSFARERAAAGRRGTTTACSRRCSTRSTTREVLAPGARGNLFQLHDDNPKEFDAWNVDIDYLDHSGRPHRGLVDRGCRA